MARTYADAVRSALARRTVKSALARRTVKSAQTADLDEVDRIFGLGDYGPLGKATLKEQAYDAITHLQSPEDRALWRKLDLPGQLKRLKETQDWLDAAKAKVRKMTADDRISLEYARKGLAMNALKNSPREKVTPLKPKMPAPPAVSHVPIPTPSPSTGVQPPPPIVAPSAGALPQTAKKPDAVKPYHPNVGGLLAATIDDPDAGRPVDTAAVARGGLMYTLRNKILTRRNLGIAGGLALAGGLSAIAYRYISDYLARKREEEEKRRMAQTKQAFAPPPGAAPGIPRDVRYFGRIPESVMRSIRSNSRRGGRAGAIAALIATLATGGALAGGLAASRKPPSAYDKLVAALKSTTAKRIGIGLGGAALGAGAVGAGIAAPKILDKLRNGGMGLDLNLFGGGDKEKDKGKEKEKTTS